MRGDPDSLLVTWRGLFEPPGAPLALVDGAFHALAQAYSRPERHYHNLDHVAELLRTLDGLAGHVRDRPAVYLAAWFHDAVYDSRAGDNEERSADRAGRVLRVLGTPTATIDRVRTLILMTKHHQTGGDPDGEALIDADLAILGAPDEGYDRYAAAIRREYAWVPEEQYRAGRAQVLETFLQRPRLYATGPLFNVLEGRARDNLRREIAGLTGAGP